MSAIKDQLIEHIEAYAIARTSGNAILASLSATALNTLLDTLLIHDDTSPPELQTPEAQVPPAPQIQTQAPLAPLASAPEAPGDGFELPPQTPAPRVRGRRAG
jgi:hypothetical protein